MPNKLQKELFNAIYSVSIAFYDRLFSLTSLSESLTLGQYTTQSIIGVIVIHHIRKTINNKCLESIRGALNFPHTVHNTKLQLSYQVLFYISLKKGKQTLGTLISKHPSFCSVTDKWLNIISFVN